MPTKLLYKALLDMPYIRKRGIVKSAYKTTLQGTIGYALHKKKELSNVSTKLFYKALMDMPYIRKRGIIKCSYKTTL